MESEDKFVERLAKRHSLSPAAVQVVLVGFVEEVDGWHNSVTLILAGCRNGRRACRWLATCSIPNSNPGSTRFARISFLIWTASEVVGGA